MKKHEAFLAVELGEILGEKLAILTDELVVEEDFSAPIIRALNRHHVPVDP